MSEVLIPKALALTFGAFAVAVAWFMYANAAHPDATKNSIIAMGSLIPILAAIAGYFGPSSTSNQVDVAVFYDNQAKAFTLGDDLGNAYAATFGFLWAGTKVDAPSLEAAGDKGVGLDLVERAFVRNLSMRFIGSWDMSTKWFFGPGGISMRSSTAISDIPGATFTAEDLQRIFAHNSLAHDLPMRTLTLPPDTKISASGDARKREIDFVNPDFAAHVVFESQSMFVLQHGVPGMIAAPADSANGRYYSFVYRVSTGFYPNRLSAYSELMPAYRRWYSGLEETARELSWTAIQERLGGASPAH